MRTKLMLAGATVATAFALTPMPTASAICDATFFEHTGYCSPCQLAAAHSQRPDPIFCPL